jgi:hypothetical protein
MTTTIHCGDALTVLRTSRGRFVKGQHWRPRQPWWDRAWLVTEYVEHQRSSADIAAEYGCTENNILYWLGKHGIPGRSISEARTLKHWGPSGERNPMYGRIGALNPNWRGGLTPARQAIYASYAWRVFRRAVRKRDVVCRLCGTPDQLEIHHIERFADAPLLVMDLGNAILLCVDCHRGLRGKERRWRRRLLTLIGEGGAPVR